jgi:hypothetical protein
MLIFMSLAIMISLLAAYYLIALPFLANPLRHVPGPRVNKISNIPLAFFDVLLRRRDRVLKWHRNHGPVVAIAPTEVSVATLDATRQIYNSSNRYEKSGYFKHFEGYDDISLFATRSSEAHKDKRKLTSSFYQASNIYNDPSFDRSIHENVAYVLRYIDDHMNHTACIDVYSITDWYAFDNITRLVLGPVHCSKALQTQCPEREMLSHLKRCQLWGPFRVRFPWFSGAMSFVAQKLTVKLGYLKAEEELAKWSYNRVLQIFQSQDQINHRSLIQVLSKHASRRRHPEELDGFTITPSFIAAEVLDNINAAEATVSVTATYALYNLSRHRIWQKRIRDELRQLPLPPGRQGLPSFSDVHKAPVMEACLLEIYRLNPAISGRSERVIPDKGSVIEGVHIPANVWPHEVKAALLLTAGCPRQ